MSFWSGLLYTKTEFLFVLNRIRQRTLSRYIFRKVFENCNIFSTNKLKILKQFQFFNNSFISIIDISVSNYIYYREIVSLIDNSIFSNISNTLFKNIKQLQKNQKKNIDLAELPIKNQQNLNKIFQHNLDIYKKLQVAEEQFAIAQNIISNIHTA